MSAKRGRRYQGSFMKKMEEIALIIALANEHA
jgi:hypothetical protein